MATKRKHEDDSIAGRLTKRLKTDTIEAEQKLDEVWKDLNDQLGAIQYPAVTEEEVDQWETTVKEALEKYSRFDRMRFKFPPQLREYLKLTGKAIKDYTDHSPRKDLLQSFYGKFIADFDGLLAKTKDAIEGTTGGGMHTETKQDGQRVYWFCICGESEECSILVNCDSQDEQNFGAVYYTGSDVNDDGLTNMQRLSSSLTEFFNLLTTSMQYEAFPGFLYLKDLPKWMEKGALGHECEIDTFKDGSWKLIDATTRSKPVRELIESEKGTVYVPLFLRSANEDELLLRKDSYGELMLKIVGKPDEENTQVTFDATKPILFMVNKWTGMGHIGTLNDAKDYIEDRGDKALKIFIEYPILDSILGSEKLDLVKIDQFWLKSASQQS
jgi:hypothetical protein